MSAVDAHCRRRDEPGGHDLDRGHGAPHVDRLLHDGDKVALGSSTFTVIETPGHSEGSICLYCRRCVLGRTPRFSDGRFWQDRFPSTGSMEKMLETLQRRFAHIPDDVIVYPDTKPPRPWVASAPQSGICARKARTLEAILERSASFSLRARRVSSIIPSCACDSSVAQRQSPRLFNRVVVGSNPTRDQHLPGPPLALLYTGV